MIKSYNSDMILVKISERGYFNMDKTVCELFAGVGGFRCGLNGIKTVGGAKDEKWNTVWFNQWEPSEKNTQYAHDCYVYHFGTCLDMNGNDTTNYNIEDVDKSAIPDLLEYVDRLLKSPAKQRGRDFAIMLACFRDEGYDVEWRVINAAEYGYPQRRRRVFIFAYKNDTKYAINAYKNINYGIHNTLESNLVPMCNLISKLGFFAMTFPVKKLKREKLVINVLPKEIGKISDLFSFKFENTGVMKDGNIFTAKTVPMEMDKQITLGDVMDSGEVANQYFIPEEKLYYTSPEVTHSNETEKQLSFEQRHTWQYIKGAKKLLRKATNGHEYVYSEGAIAMIDSDDKPARTMLTSEGNFSRSTHIVKDKQTGKIRLLTANETERIQGFPTDFTKYCFVDGERVDMPERKRRFMMGNALVVNLVEDMEKTLEMIFDEEG